MKIYHNGIYREMTEEELKAYEEEMKNLPKPQPSQEELLQAQIDDLNLIMADLLGGNV